MKDIEGLTKFEVIMLQKTNQIISLLETIASNKNVNDFEISTLTQASIVLKCSVPTLRKAIKNNTLKNGIDYRTNEAKKYLFSISSLEKYKGKI